jgi:hypothetical protein
MGSAALVEFLMLPKQVHEFVHIALGLPVRVGPGLLLVSCPEFKRMRGDFSDLVDLPILDLQDQESQGVSVKDEVRFSPGAAKGRFVLGDIVLVRAGGMVEEAKDLLFAGRGVFQNFDVFGVHAGHRISIQPVAECQVTAPSRSCWAATKAK